MWIILGLIGSVVMVVLEATHVTDISYWWSAVPLVIGIMAQLGLDEIFSIFE